MFSDNRSQTVRPAAVAGMFYPADPEELRAMLREMLAQAEHIPVHLGSMPASVAAILERFGADAEPGLQYAVNDPFAGGTHLNDLTLVRPVAHWGYLIGFVANRAHHADVGGHAPGSMAPKLESAIDFAKARGRYALICALDQIAAALAGRAGTRVG